MKQVIPPTLALLVAAATCCQGAGPPDARRIDVAIQEALKAWRVPGAAVGIVQGGKVVYLKGHGVRSVEKKDPVTSDTVFPIASCTKAFTTAAMAQLADAGKLRWDDPVRKHLPWFRLGDPLADREVRLRDLVTHRTGLAGHDLLWYRSPWTQEEIIRRAGLLPLDRPFRSAFQYQSTMFGAAGLAAAQAAGCSWEKLVGEGLLTPLQMERTVFTSTAARKLEPAHGHRLNREGQTELAEAYPLETPDPAGSIHSCARDLCRWLAFHLSEGKAGERRLVSAQALAETHTPQMVIPLVGLERRLQSETNQMSYGNGWVVYDYRGKLLCSHAGAIDGFRAHLTLLPREGIGIVLLCNLHQTRMNLALSNTLVDLLLDLPRRDWNRYLLEVGRQEADRQAAEARARHAKHQPGAQPSLPLPDYAGAYEHPAYGRVEISVEGPMLRWRWNSFTLRLEHYHFDTFVLGDGVLEGTEAQFQLGADGKVQAIQMTGAIPVTFRRKPARLEK